MNARDESYYRQLTNPSINNMRGRICNRDLIKLIQAYLGSLMLNDDKKSHIILAHGNEYIPKPYKECLSRVRELCCVHGSKYDISDVHGGAFYYRNNWMSLGHITACRNWPDDALVVVCCWDSMSEHERLNVKHHCKNKIVITGTRDYYENG